MSWRNRAFARLPAAVEPMGPIAADDGCRFPDNPYRLTSRWKLLPSFAAAYSEAQQIVYVLERSGKYGFSRRTNGRGVAYKGPPRFLDRFKDKKHALSSVTKTILMDRYGELPSTLTRSEVRL